MNVQRSSTNTLEHPEVQNASETRLHRFWLLAARLSLLAITVLNLIIYIIGAPIYFAQLLPSNHNCFEDCLTPANTMQPAHVSLWLRPSTHQHISWSAISSITSEDEARDEM